MQINEVGQLVGNWWVAMKRNRSTTSVSRAFLITKRHRPETQIKEVKECFRAFGALDLGRYVPGRHRSPCRFEWADGAKERLSKLLKASSDQPTRGTHKLEAVQEARSDENAATGSAPDGSSLSPLDALDGYLQLKGISGYRFSDALILLLPVRRVCTSIVANETDGQLCLTGTLPLCPPENLNELAARIGDGCLDDDREFIVDDHGMTFRYRRKSSKEKADVRTVFESFFADLYEIIGAVF